MSDIPVKDFVFVVSALIGGGPLPITVVLDDTLGAIFQWQISHTSA